MKLARLALACLALGWTGCLPEARAVQPRYFTPSLPGAEGTAEAATSASGAVREEFAADRSLRMGRVRAAAHLKERMAWRRSDVELGFHELLRWTQAPARFVEQAISAELFQRRGFRRAESGANANLEVQLRAFDEILDGERSALVELGVQLSDRRRASLLERTLRARVPVQGGDAAAFARAMGAALEQVVRELADAVETALP